MQPAKQRAAQQQAQTKPDGIARIGDRDPKSGSWYVQFPDGGIGANGIKTYTAASKPGDVVVMYPRPDGSIALDSEKGSPTIFPPVFNKPVPDAKKAKVWILYFFGGKLWVGGHQSQPEEVGTVYHRGMPQPPVLESDGGPGFILEIGNSSNLHVWGDASGWVATYQTFLPNFDFTNATTFHAVTSTTRKKYSTSFGFNESGTATGYNADGIDYNERSFPLGAGFVSYRSMRDISSVEPPPIPDNVYRTYSTVQQVTIGYMENAVPTFHQFSSGESFLGAIHSGLLLNEAVSYNGTIPIPNLDRQTILPYSGNFSCPEAYASEKGPYFNRDSPQKVVLPILTVQSVHNYPILCDRSSTYYIQESININASPSFNAGSSIQKVYELRSTVSPVVIATNTTEPRFFGIRWDLRASAYTEGAWDRYFGKTSGAYGYAYSKYSDPAYFYPTYNFNAVSQGHALPVGRFKMINNNDFYRRSSNNIVLPLDEYYDYPYFVTFSGGQVVTIEASEINKAKIGGTFLQRRSVSVDGKFLDIGPTFCHPIPSTAIIYHWSTTA